ncbi:MAG: glycosyltransferase, partial [Acidobacteriaceae bacterium]|nr:glycosyltransferase [Acidobacteriaceae bacterium]
MKVLYLNPSGQLGGAETSLLTLVEGRRRERREFRPIVVTTEEGPFTRRCAELEIPHLILPLPMALECVGDAEEQDGHWGNRVARLLCCSSDFIRFAAGIRKLLHRVRPDIIHTNGFKMHIACAWALGGPNAEAAVVGHIHDYVSNRPLAGRLLRTVSNRFSWFIANSRSVAS